MIGTIAKALVVASLGWVVALSQAQSMTTAADASCGNDAVDFKVSQAHGQAPAQAPPGKALVIFIGKDVGAMVASTTRAGLDGDWIGATHGDSWFWFEVDPGVHHLCASTHFSGWAGGGGGLALVHFEARAGQVYYFEAKSFTFNGERQTDVSLFPVDSDEGRYLQSVESFSTSVRKK